jgi:hypothetical protein
MVFPLIHLVGKPHLELSDELLPKSRRENGRLSALHVSFKAGKQWLQVVVSISAETGH